MRRITEIPVVGSAAAAGVDLLVFGGETLVAVGLAILTSLDLWLPMLSYLSTVADAVDWLPADPIESVLLVAAVLFVVYYAYRLARRAVRAASNRDTDL